MPIIQTKNLFKIYNEDIIPVYALRDLSLDFEKGEFTTIVGPSGSGKTTLLNMIGGLDTPTRGQVFIDGTDISKLRKGELIEFRLKNIGFVFQSYNLIPVLSAIENVSLIMELQNRAAKEIKERAEKVLEEVGLSGKMHSKPSELSGGQQQRVAVARALASRPKFVLADEPTANLDTKAAMNLLDIMARLNQEENMTFIFSTHDQRVIERARRVVTLVDGALHEDLRK
ncbi:ABC transporter ATP-binding protein [Cecembia calidifontis]|jgi:putative ABC transport system ATP-binding protein|uniref:Putative ABC transport system ATP-binding protein n=1 Tax=Cecembia calidifontis TaxID=1187080 RepID=A0A4V2F6R7_9BACT|nr:ABC transporter ATP-binding protein [Cecembia calidifontis]RZS97259.1 putative ABC transport system ATP-binding protein [Cecembia calidifontis]